MEKYTLEFLSEEFEKHSVELVKNKEMIKKQYEEMNPDDPIVDNITEEFNLPKALKIIVDEIRGLSERLSLIEYDD